MTKHTPGPWQHDRCQVVNPDGYVVASITDCHRNHQTMLSEEEVAANASLLAAAPDMLAELRAVVEVYGPVINADRVREINTLLAKAGCGEPK